ncbi:hypothetical protein BXZ70DRAFT_895244 [Cristinia sonorae]|uniref:Uncharacterized protein n=1 Tax=Cristinia sonorae TaxID=1940300 RepID=A0A8K0XNG3_9AGAR|nr:hypothetical protein BXZ70DRAFT_895244 [Cristinia sonorae]
MASETLPCQVAHLSLNTGSDVAVEAWTPIPLRLWFWIPLVLIMALGAVAFELVLYTNKRTLGWATRGRITTEQGVMHFLYTFPPVAISMGFSALWAWTDIEIRKLQVSHNTLWVWFKAWRNRHCMVTSASILVILTFSFQPLSAALFSVQEVWWTEPDISVAAFLTAAGYASANVLYNIGDPRFTHQGWVIGEFEVPNISNGTVYLNTTAVLTEPRCVSMTLLPNNTGWQNMASFEGCPFTWDVDLAPINLFGVGPIPDSEECSHLTSIPLQYRPILFWFFTYEPQPMSSISMCTPTLSLWNVEATLDLATHSLTDVKAVSPFIPSLLSTQPVSSDLSRLAGNITGYPLNGRAYNGLFFDLTVNASDPYVNSRLAAIQLALPAAVFQAAVSSEEGLTGVVPGGDFVELANRVYGMYLSLLARTVYFLDYSKPITVRVKTIHKRLFLSDLAVHLLAVVMLILSIGGTVLQLAHRHARRRLPLAHPPGTIASALSLAGRGDVMNVLVGTQKRAEMKAVLEGKTFGLGYENGTKTMTLVQERDSVYARKEGKRKRGDSLVTGWVKRSKGS